MERSVDAVLGLLGVFHDFLYGVDYGEQLLGAFSN